MLLKNKFFMDIIVINYKKYNNICPFTDLTFVGEITKYVDTINLNKIDSYLI